MDPSKGRVGGRALLSYLWDRPRVPICLRRACPLHNICFVDTSETTAADCDSQMRKKEFREMKDRTRRQGTELTERVGYKVSSG